MTEESIVQGKVAEMKGVPAHDELVKQLQNEVVVVTFNKMNGDQRIMTCTKSFDVIPEENHPKSDNTPKKGVVTVWDTTAQGWRSFKYDRVTNVDSAK